MSPIIFFGKYHAQKLTKICFPILLALRSCELQLAAVYHKVCILKKTISERGEEEGRRLQKRFTQYMKYIPKVVNMVRESEKKRVTGEFERNISSFFKRRFQELEGNISSLTLKEDFRRWRSASLLKNLPKFSFKFVFIQKAKMLRCRPDHAGADKIISWDIYVICRGQNHFALVWTKLWPKDNIFGQIKISQTWVH